jgi:hypothetical protein
MPDAVAIANTSFHPITMSPVAVCSIAVLRIAILAR